MAIIDYISPNTWADQEMNWTQVQTRNARYADAIRLALLERALAVGATDIARPLAAFQATPFSLLDTAKLATIHAAAKALPPYFANHTSIDGETSYEPIPDWTADLILKYIGAEVFYEPETAAYDLADWFMLMHDYINMMLYTSEEVPPAEELDPATEAIRYGFYRQYKYGVASESGGVVGNPDTYSNRWSNSDGTESTEGGIREAFDPYGSRVAASCESAYGQAAYYQQWGGTLESGASCILTMPDSGAQTPNAGPSWGAQKYHSKVFFRVENNTDFPAPPVDIKIIVKDDKKIVSTYTLEIPEVAPGATLSIPIADAPEFAVVPNEGRGYSRGYSFTFLPEETAEPEAFDKLYRLVSHNLKFKEA